jgi:hypothetical protein
VQVAAAEATTGSLMYVNCIYENIHDADMSAIAEEETLPFSFALAFSEEVCLSQASSPLKV